MAVSIDFTGKTVIITGAGRGIGKDVALAFSDAGANVYIGNRNVEEGNQTVKEIEAKGGRAGFTRCDVAKKEDVEKLVADGIAFGNGDVECIVNCAGIFSTIDRMDISENEFNRVMDVNVLGTMNIIDAGFKYMIPRKHGNIITYSSIAGKRGCLNFPTYGASKAAIINITQGAAKVGGPHGIRVNGIAPGDVHTKMWDQIIDGMISGFNGDLPEGTLTSDERDRKYDEFALSGIPLGRSQTGKDMAMATLFLASDLAENISGQTLTVDGGKTML